MLEIKESVNDGFMGFNFGNSFVKSICLRE